MPGPTILGWCTNSFSSLQRSVHQMITGFTKIEPEEPKSLLTSAINRLRGKTPAEKHRFLNYTVQSIANESPNCTDSDNFSPFVRTTAAVQLKLQDLVLEALKSTDSDVARCALKADWFFTPENVDLKKFQTLFLSVSLTTRKAIIKKLSRTLIGSEEKAAQFFDGIVGMYGVDEALPILKACSENFIFEKVLQHKITLSVKMVDELYKRMPDLVVKYLQLGDKNNIDNEDDRKIHEISIHEYDSFIPKLIKNYPKVFVELYTITPEKTLILGEKKSDIFMKSLKNEVLSRPRIFLKLLSLDVVCENLTKDQMVILVENMFPKSINDFNLDEILDLVDHYHHGNKIELLKDKYLYFYDRELLDDENLMRSTRLQKMVGSYDRKSKARFFARKYEHENPDKFLIFVSYLPPEESLPILITKQAAATSAEERTKIFGHAVTSCNVYHSKVDLLEVMKIFLKTYDQNSQTVVVHRFIQYLKENFKLETLDESHWWIIEEIILMAYVKGELFNTHVTAIESILEDILRYLMSKQKNTNHEDKIIEIIVEGKITKFSPSWNIMKDDPKLEKECLERFFQLIPLKYPENDEVWMDKDSKLSLTLSIVKTIDSFNERNSKKKSRKSRENELCIKIQNYPWILKLTNQFFVKSDNTYRRKKLLHLVKKLAPEVYESKLDQYCHIRDIESGEATALLKSNYKKILNNWLEYLVSARIKLVTGKKGARRFVSAVKWYNEISDKFVERCLEEINDNGSLIVLGILLDGESFEGIVAPLIPNDVTFNPEKEDAKDSYERTRVMLQAMRHVNPPMSIDLIAVFCHKDYALLCEGVLSNLVSNYPADKVGKFSKNLIVNRSSIVRKQAIRMYRSVATRDDLRKFLEDIWRTEKDTSVRFTIAKVIFENFCKVPNSKNWNLMKTCIEGLTVDDKRAIEKFSDIEFIDRNYISPYIEEYLQKVEYLANHGMDSATRTKCVCLVIEGIDEKIMSYLLEETSSMILKKYFLDIDSLEISQVVQNFAMRSYLLPAKEKLDTRLDVIMKILTGIMSNFDKPYPKKPRHFAANYTIHEFFGSALTEISCSDSASKKDIIESMLNVFKSTLSPYQESWTYLSLNLYKEYLQARTPKEFGVRCANRVPTLIEEFSANDTVVNDAATCLEDFINYKIYRNIDPTESKLSIIEGMLEGDDHYGALLATKLLNHEDTEIYDERYDKIVKCLRNKKSEIVLYNIYNVVNRVKPYNIGG